MYEINVNYISVLVTAVISFFIGAFWYSPLLFAKQWKNAMGKTEKDTEEGSSVFYYVMTFFAWLIASYVLAVIIDYGVDLDSNPQFLYGMLAAFLCWFGFVAAIGLVLNVFTQRPVSLWLVDSGYVLVAFLIGGAILAEWR